MFFLENRFLPEGGEKVTVMFYSFVVCVKKDGMDKILLSGLKWGYTRDYDSSFGLSRTEAIEPKCTGLKDFPRGVVQNTINEYESMGGPLDGGYNYKDQWIWDR